MSKHVLLLGGHGKVAQLLTPLLLQRAWTVTSVIRAPEQVPAIRQLGERLRHQGTLNVLVSSLEDVGDVAAAQAILDSVKPDYVVWSAGAAGRGGPERTFRIDRDAAISFIRAAAATPSVSRFVLVSYLAARRRAAPWWDPADGSWQQANASMPAYYEAKLAADEVLLSAGRARGGGFAAVSLRPGLLTDGAAGGVELGRTKAARGTSARASVARVAEELLAAEGVRTGWVDMLDGEEEIGEAVRRIVKEGVDAAEEEPGV